MRDALTPLDPPTMWGEDYRMDASGCIYQKRVCGIFISKMNSEIKYTFADSSVRDQIRSEWGDKAADHMNLETGFAIAASSGGEIVGLISSSFNILPNPLPDTGEVYIDIIEVIEKYRRQGVASRMIDLTISHAKEYGAYQVRAWSSEDKIEAIPMWNALGFAMCPAAVYPRGEKVKGYYVVKVL